MSHFAYLTQSEQAALISELAEFIVAHSAGRTNRTQAAEALFAFDQAGHDLVALHGYLYRATCNGDDPLKILSNLIHDLNGRNEKFFDPRSSSYADQSPYYLKWPRKYRRMDNIGRARYTISTSDGRKTHPDGSQFFDIAIFSNKKKMQAYVNDLIRKGYTER